MGNCALLLLHSAIGGVLWTSGMLEPGCLAPLYSKAALSWAKTMYYKYYSFGPTQRGPTIVMYIVVMTGIIFLS